MAKRPRRESLARATPALVAVPAAAERRSVRTPVDHKLRIVGGAWKRTPLFVSAIGGLRPTPDRVRETLFNWLGQKLDGLRCLDAFAGTGALGLEAASRGAAWVVIIERDRRALAAIRRFTERLGAGQVELVAADALVEFDRRIHAGERFDVVFLDPPFGEGLLDRALARLPALLAPRARIYAESETALDPVAGFHVVRAGRAGRVHYHLLMQDDDIGAGHAGHAEQGA